MKTHTIRPKLIVVVAAVAAILAASIAGCSNETKQPSQSKQSTQAETTSAQAETTGGATGGKALGDPALAQQEENCVARLPDEPYDQTLVRTFNSDSAHTGVFGCAQFAGSMTGQNGVEAYQTSTVYKSPFTTSTRGPNDVYVYGGCNAGDKPPALVSYVARVEPSSLKQVWKTRLSDATKSNAIHLCGSVETLADGSLIATDGHRLWKLDGTTGKIVAKLDVPNGKTPEKDVAINGSVSTPDGTIILKTWNRVAGCTQNGIFAMYKCKGALTGKATPSILTAVDPEGLKVLDSVNIGTNIGSRISTAAYRGHDYVYITSSKQLFRYEWDGNTLKKDKNWGPVGYTRHGETGGGTPTPMNGWIIQNTNGIRIPMHIAAISQADGSMTSIQPNKFLPPRQHSTSAAKPTVDPANNRIYMCDFNLGTCSAIDLRDGRLSLAWKEDMRTQAFTSLIGPPDKRVFVASNMKSSKESDPTKYDYGPKGANFTEQYQWRDAASGKLLAASDYYPPKAEASQTPPGYGGLIYGLTNNGKLLTLYVQPKE
jgi:hypothetical protein